MSTKEHLCTITIVLLVAQSTMLLVHFLAVLASGQMQVGYWLGFTSALFAAEWAAHRIRPVWN